VLDSGNPIGSRFVGRSPWTGVPSGSDALVRLRVGRLRADFHGPDPYTRGYFGFRTTFSHIEFRRFRIMR
jgi:hypothetical protein